MIKVKILGTGEILDLSRNEAFGLIDKGEAVRMPEGIERNEEYEHRQMHTKRYMRAKERKAKKTVSKPKAK